MTIKDCKPGQKVRITQVIDRREGNWQSEVVGTIEWLKQQKTGSWFAHSKDDKLWLYRVRLKKDDGELTTLTVDPLMRVDVVD